MFPALLMSSSSGVVGTQERVMEIVMYSLCSPFRNRVAFTIFENIFRTPFYKGGRVSPSPLILLVYLFDAQTGGQGTSGSFCTGFGPEDLEAMFGQDRFESFDGQFGVEAGFSDDREELEFQGYFTEIGILDRHFVTP
jgi:hypothetical protein